MQVFYQSDPINLALGGVKQVMMQIASHSVLMHMVYSQTNKKANHYVTNNEVKNLFRGVSIFWN